MLLLLKFLKKWLFLLFLEKCTASKQRRYVCMQIPPWRLSKLGAKEFSGLISLYRLSNFQKCIKMYCKSTFLQRFKVSLIMERWIRHTIFYQFNICVKKFLDSWLQNFERAGFPNEGCSPAKVGHYQTDNVSTGTKRPLRGLIFIALIGNAMNGPGWPFMALNGSFVSLQ